MENIGQLKVLRKDQNKPLSKVYVKVYSQSRGGSVDFYKDGVSIRHVFLNELFSCERNG
jgi:hypothetical protein